MVYSLGIDTGGTYTDAVILRDQSEVLASAKSLTTHQDLAIGIVNSVQQVLQNSVLEPSAIDLACLSTTLATNALVEGQGEAVGLITLGFEGRDMQRAGLAQALAGNPHISLAGGHAHTGGEKTPLDVTPLETWCQAHPYVAAFAVAGVFATRNPSHEQRVAEELHRITGKPVSASHHLSAKLNGPKRALTALLNARLIGMISRLISRAEAGLSELGVEAPLMVVRGDGALIAAASARARPIETILSGPAASIVGARWLSDAQEAFVSDIGGTTTDIARLENGQPRIDPDGARVGPYRTMVEAVAMRTSGLGGDSEVHLNARGKGGQLVLGPRRVVPISLLASEAPQIVHDCLNQQLSAPIANEHEGRFLRPHPGNRNQPANERDAALLKRIEAAGVAPQGALLRARLDHAALGRLVAQGMVQIAALTPSDAAHALGHLSQWDGAAADKALQLFARKKTNMGEYLSDSAETMARLVIAQLTAQTRDLILEAALVDDEALGSERETFTKHILLQKALAGHRGILSMNAALDLPVIGLGASASTYYPAVGKALKCQMILPRYAHVANAIGAVVGQVSIRKSGTVTSPAEGQARAHLSNGVKDFADPEDAMQKMRAHLSAEARHAAIEAGADQPALRHWRAVQTAQIDGREMFVEATIHVEASGRPRIARSAE